MESKKEFKAPEIEIVRFEVKDIIMVSKDLDPGIKLPDHEW